MPTSIQPAISILMPVKSAMPYLEACIKSILVQSFSNWELIAVDDHSIDGSMDYLQTVSGADRRIKVFENPGEGIIQALRFALSQSAGGLITRMDADDLMTSDKLESMSESLLKHGQGHVAVGLVNYFSEGRLGLGYRQYAQWLNKAVSSGQPFKEIYKECVIPSPAWMVHREDLYRCGAFDSDIYPEDYDLCFRFYKFGLICLPTSGIVHQWRDYDHRTSRIDEKYADNRFLELKSRYFVELELDGQTQLVLWGAGKKGKWLARYFKERNISFEWITDNKKKIGHTVYGQVIRAAGTIHWTNQMKVIVAVANPEENQLIVNKMAERGLGLGENVFPFC